VEKGIQSFPAIRTLANRPHAERAFQLVSILENVALQVSYKLYNRANFGRAGH
jgi:hypothetical protein